MPPSDRRHARHMHAWDFIRLPHLANHEHRDYGTGYAVNRRRGISNTILDLAEPVGAPARSCTGTGMQASVARLPLPLGRMVLWGAVMVPGKCMHTCPRPVGPFS